MITVAAVFQDPVGRRFSLPVRHRVYVYHDAIVTCFGKIVRRFGQILVQGAAVQGNPNGSVALGVYFWTIQQIFLKEIRFDTLHI